MPCRFEWDEPKRLANLLKHGLDFRRAAEVFAGDCFSYPSPRQTEDRWVTVGSGRGRPDRDCVDPTSGCHPGNLDEEGKA